MNGGWSRRAAFGTFAAVGLAPAAVAADPPAAAGDVTRYGAKGDGTTDDTAAFQRALDAAAKAGGVVAVPAGRYLVRGGLTVPLHVILEGLFRSPTARS